MFADNISDISLLFQQLISGHNKGSEHTCNLLIPNNQVKLLKILNDRCAISAFGIGLGILKSYRIFPAFKDLTVGVGSPCNVIHNINK